MLSGTGSNRETKCIPRLARYNPRLALIGFLGTRALGLKVTKHSWLLLFAFSLPLFFLFSCLISVCHFLFLFAGHLVGFILEENVSGKAFRILGLLDESKGRWVVKQDFQGNFMANGTWFFPIFFDLLDWIVLILVWFFKLVSCPWPLKPMTSQAVEGTWIRTVG